VAKQCDCCVLGRFRKRWKTFKKSVFCKKLNKKMKEVRGAAWKGILRLVTFIIFHLVLFALLWIFVAAGGPIAVAAVLAAL
jgi:hypothetical protein